VLASKPGILIEAGKHVPRAVRPHARLIAGGFFDPPPTASTMRKEVKRTGGNFPEINIGRIFGTHFFKLASSGGMTKPRVRSLDAE
jgi:hypothetical protein